MMKGFMITTAREILKTCWTQLEVEADLDAFCKSECRMKRESKNKKLAYQKRICQNCLKTGMISQDKVLAFKFGGICFRRKAENDFTTNECGTQ